MEVQRGEGVEVQLGGGYPLVNERRGDENGRRREEVRCEAMAVAVELEVQRVVARGAGCGCLRGHRECPSWDGNRCLAEA